MASASTTAGPSRLPPPPTASSSSGINMMAASSTNGNDTAAGKKPRRRLPEAASALLSNYYDNVSVNPSLKERKELLAQIVRISGAEWYTPTHVASWFNSRNNYVPTRRYDVGEDTQGGASSDTDKILWPSLTSDKISKLATLLRETPNPTAIHLHVWSRTLEADRQHVDNWVQLRQAQIKQEHEPSTLPTPEGTASPEPRNARTTTPPVPPLAGQSTLYEQKYVGYGFPARLGSSSTRMSHEEAFVAVQPIAPISYPTPNTPISPITRPRTSFSVSRPSTPQDSPRPPPVSQTETGKQSPTVPTDVPAATSRGTKRKLESVDGPYFMTKSAPSLPFASRSDSLRTSLAVTHTPNQDNPLPGVPTGQSSGLDRRPSAPIMQGEGIASKSPLVMTASAPLLATARARPSASFSLTSSLASGAGQIRTPFIRDLCKIVKTKLTELKSEPALPPPRSFAELSQRMAPTFKFYEALERGDYAAIGLVPSKRHRGDTNELDDRDDLSESMGLDDD